MIIDCQGAYEIISRHLYKFVMISALLMGLAIGYHLFENFKEQSSVENLPKTVAILGPYSAKSGISEANRIASIWDASSQLQSVFSAFGGDYEADDPGMGANGIPIAPSGWRYRFFSTTKGWFLDLTLWPDGRCEGRSFDGFNYRDTAPLPAECLDSTEALSIAEELYGKRYREKGVLFRLIPVLTTSPSCYDGPKDTVPDRAIWRIEYLTTRKEDRVDLFLFLDAVTGKELCAIEFFNSEIHVLTNNY